jgi:DNA-binding CsgD family transcriptional regulator
MIEKSQRLTTQDIRKIFHLVGEIIELGRDPAVWRLHLLRRLLVMVDARAGIACEMFVSPTAPKVVGLVDTGWSPQEQQLFYSHANAGGMTKDPFHAPVQRLLHRSFTRRRRDLVSDEDWYSSPIVVPLRRQCNVDDQIYSRWNLPQPGWAHVITPMRGWGAKNFTPHERFFVSLLHREIGRLWAQVDTGPLSGLPPRLRQTLDMVFSGYTEKEIAAALKLSAHSVHDFTRRLYRHFNVSSRSELFADPACRQLLFKPTLSFAYYADRRGLTEGTFPSPDGEVPG